jgi:fatty acid desaturase
LLPSVPYHALGEAHRRITAHLGAGSTFDRASYTGFMPLLAKIARSTMVRR